MNCVHWVKFQEFSAQKWEVFYSIGYIALPQLGNLRKAVEDGDGNVGKTIKLITQDKKRTWICEIKLTFVPSCSRVRRQLLHFHVVCKTWSIFQQLSSIFSFRKRRWRQLKFSENRNKQWNQRKYVSAQKANKDYVEIFLLLADVAVLDCLATFSKSRLGDGNGHRN